jgi:protein-tyrosine phosphatase
MTGILFVCHGNICRSPMAEFMMKDLAKRRGQSSALYVESAATTTEEIWRGRGNPIYPPALAELRRHGIGTPDNELGVSAKRARLMTREDYARFDYLIGMDSENLYDMKDIAGGDPEGKISLLLDYTDHRRSVADPWYTGNFTATWNDCEAGILGLWDFLVKRGQLPGKGLRGKATRRTS